MTTGREGYASGASCSGRSYQAGQASRGYQGDDYVSDPQGPTRLTRNGESRLQVHEGWQPECNYRKITLAKKPIKKKRTGQDLRNLDKGLDGLRFQSNGRVQCLYVATHNTRTMSTDYQLQAYIEATAKIKADVIGICETRRKEE